MIENFNLIEMIEAMEPRQSEDNVNLIINFSRQINSAMKDVEGIGYLKTDLRIVWMNLEITDFNSSYCSTQCLLWQYSERLPAANG